MEREAFRRLPGLLADLFDERESAIHLEPATHDAAVDAVVDARGRHWLVQVKTSSRPGVVDAVADGFAERFAAGAGNALPVLVVPYMTPAGARKAAERDLNWIDLSGNACLRDENLYVFVQGRPSKFVARGRPSSAFAPKSSRIARTMLLDPERWWRQKDLAAATDLDDGHVSRIVRRLHEGHLLQSDHGAVRPRDPALLLDEWSDEYRFDRHDAIVGHASGSGIELAHHVHARLCDAGIRHAFTGLPAAWVLDPFARFRLNSVYVAGDPREAAEAIGLRRHETGANVQLIGPDDRGVFAGQRDVEKLPCVAPVQVYLDLLHLPERARDAAVNLRDAGLWNALAG